MNPVYVALIKRLLIFGKIDRGVFVMCLMVTPVIMASTRSFIAGAIFFGLGVFAGWLAGKGDPKIIQIIARRLRFASLYDSAAQ